ncbi:MAG: copper chaperone PCu(A)C [Candidatus Nanopelagicales bacterium]
MLITRRITRRTAALPAAALLGLGLLTGCASSETDVAASPTAMAEGCTVTASDTWVKATDTEMTGAFGILTNTGTAEVTVVSATSPVAGMMEIHEVVDKDGEMVMQPKSGGLVIPVGGTATLAPGKDHLMLMKLPAPIEAGQTVEITMTCADGATAAYSGVAKPFEGGAESYVPGASMDPMEGMDASASPSS